jgi:hypothetical protein
MLSGMVHGAHSRSTLRPREFRFRQTGEAQLNIEFFLGLTGQMQVMPSRGTAQFILFMVQPKWGLRDALKQYYTFYPDYFTRRADKDGSWLFAGFHPVRVTPDTVRCVDFFAYHEIGVMHELEWEDEWEAWAQRDREVGIDAFRYIIPGQREIVYLEQLPEEHHFDTVLDAAQDGDFQLPVGLAADKLKAVVRKSVIEHQPNKRAIIPRQVFWGGNALTFIMNPDPNLGALSQGATLLAWAIAYIDTHPQFAGIYIDSLGQWFSFLNYRKDHLISAEIPATCDEQGRVALHNKHSAYTFQAQLREALHARGKLLFANGVHVDRPFNGFLTDLFGTEGGARARTKAPQMRMYAYQKPALFLCYEYESRRLVEEYVRSATQYGCFPTMGGEYYNPEGVYARDADIWRAWIPMIKVLSCAGWEPVTMARSDQQSCQIERFGPREGVCFWTLYNSSQESQSFTVEFATDELDLQPKLENPNLLLRDAMSGEPLGAWPTGVEESIVVQVDIPAGDVRVLQLTQSNRQATTSMSLQVESLYLPPSISNIQRYQVVVSLPALRWVKEQLQDERLTPLGLPGEPLLASEIEHQRGLLQLALPQGWQIADSIVEQDKVTYSVATNVSPHPGKYHIVAYWTSRVESVSLAKPMVSSAIITVDSSGEAVNWAAPQLGARVRASHDVDQAHVILVDNPQLWQSSIEESASWIELMLPVHHWLQRIEVEWAPADGMTAVKLQAYNDGSFVGEDIGMGWATLATAHPNTVESGPSQYQVTGVRTNRLRLIAADAGGKATWGVVRLRVFEE